MWGLKRPSFRDIFIPLQNMSEEIEKKAKIAKNDSLDAPEGAFREETALGDELQVYELGYHLLPIIAEESLEGEVSNIKSVIEKNGGLFIGEEGTPRNTKLTFSMSKVINNKKANFDNAYFGWVKFEATSDSILKMKEAFDKEQNILRFLLIKSVRESKMVSRKSNIALKPRPMTDRTKEIKEAGPISEVQVDKAIDELVVE